MKTEVSDFLFQNRFWKSIVRKEIPVNQWLRTKILGLGLINFYLFIILTITGILLMFYYTPDTERAYQGIKDLEYVVSFGLIFRNMHRYSAYLMLISVFLHLSRVFYTAEYREPREFNWVTGLVLFLCTGVMAITGYILPWDQKGYWAMTITSNVVTSVPVIGEKLKYLILGGNEVGQNALVHAYGMHVKIIPLVIGLVMGAHFWRIRKDDFLAWAIWGGHLDFQEGATPQTPKGQEQGPSLWKDIIIRELSKFLLILALVMGISLLFNAPLEEGANPSVTPSPVKAPWFVVGMQELLSWGAPFFFGVLVPNLMIILIILIPYVDRGREGVGVWFHPSRRIANIIFTAIVTVYLGLIIIGQFFRGPGWVFYWPWQSWPGH
ncbi:MAG: cytochrome b N-terminal domain-containing protein [Deltaproteobacteria bacterium]|nr:cytochrome b N-terminal domain-containing protein [Deltaproteobacteria bacterium]